jgi:hypothetical protein
MGANIYPGDVEQAIFRSVVDHERFGAFCMELIPTGSAHEERPCLHLELLASIDEDVVRLEMRDRLVKHLAAVNRDFRSALAEDNTAGDFQVLFHKPGTGPFAANSSRIKRLFLVQSGAPKRTR